MRRHGETASSSAPASSSPAPATPRSDWGTLKRLFPYLWQYKWRVLVALAFMVGAKLSNVGVPLLLKELVDAMSIKAGDPLALAVVPAGLLIAYGALRLCTALFTELRELIFAKATEGTARSISLQVFRHLHALSLRFHLERQTGGMTRDIERGTRAVHSLISYSLYSIFPTLIEFTLVLTLLAVKFDLGYVWITLGALVTYIAFTVTVTEWRTHFRRRMNELDSAAHNRAIDSLINYETVKYFNNEEFEAKRYDENLEKYRRAAIKSQGSLSLLNSGQQLIIATGLVAMLWRATQGVIDGRMTLGDLVMINAFMIQLYIPLGFLGVLYREIKQSLTDLDKMFVLLERDREVADAPGALPLKLPPSPYPSPRGRGNESPDSLPLPLGSSLPLPLGEGRGEGLPPQQILDLGTGSGAIALALKHTRPDARVSAVDASADALAVARANAQRLRLDVAFMQGSWLEGINNQFDLIVSNPPYIAAQDRHLKDLKHEPLQALVSGVDGLNDIRRIITQARARLHPGGWLLLEHGSDQAGAVRALLIDAGFEDVQSRPDLAGIERCSGGRTLRS